MHTLSASTNGCSRTPASRAARQCSLLHRRSASLSPTNSDMSSTAPHIPSPALIFETLNAYQRSGALHAAIELDLFTAIAEGNTAARTIAARIKGSVKGTRVLCDYLTVMGFLTKLRDDYSLTPVSSVFLDRNSPAYV